MTGADAQNSLIALYDVAGQIRAAFIALQEQVRIAMMPDRPENQTETPHGKH